MLDFNICSCPSRVQFWFSSFDLFVFSVYLGAKVLQPPQTIFFRDFPPTGPPVKPAALLFFPSVVFLLLLELPALLIWFLASSIGLPLIYGCTQGGLFFLFEAAVFDFRLRVLLTESINRERCGLLILSRAQVFLPRFSFLPPPSRLSGRCSHCPVAQLHLP
jgi:hypothetical protein